MDVNVGLNDWSLLYNQNTQEKFDAEPEDCDQKEMYKLLVSFVRTLRKKKKQSDMKQQDYYMTNLSK